MFEEGASLKKKYGPEYVFDFSLGNPNLAPPESFYRTLNQVLDEKESRYHGYMSNAGYTNTRDAVAAFIFREQGVSLSGDDVIMTCGAAGALNVIFKTILDPGDEVMVPSPYFAEYSFYVDNHGGIIRPVETNDDFTLNLKAMAQNITYRTKAVLINSPNNPTGQVYSEESLKKLGEILSEASLRQDRIIYLVSDEPYRKIVYDGISVPSILGIYRDSIVATSYSKDLSLAGERIGYVAVHPQTQFKENLVSAMILANRILGFVNAPALMQQVVRYMQGDCVDIKLYRRKRDLLCHALTDYGYDFVYPKGAFYVFPRSPIPDELVFVSALREENILTVPGRGFGRPGHFRIAFCVDDSVIEGALPGFKKIAQRFDVGR